MIVAYSGVVPCTLAILTSAPRLTSCSARSKWPRAPNARSIEREGTGKLAGMDGILVPGGFGLRGTRGMMRAARIAHQVFGAIGYCQEHLLHLLHKRILAGRLDFGDSAFHLERVADLATNIAEGVVYLPPKPFAATIARLEDADYEAAAITSATSVTS